MRRRRGIQGVASNPILVGAVTVLIALVTVFLAYNANNGLPFVPTYRLNAQVPNANALVNGNEVRVGGYRVGVVRSVLPTRLPDGRFAARLEMSLDESVNPLPVDSTVIVRNKSTIGLKYLEINPGDSPETFPEGATIPLAAARPEPVELDQFFNMFDDQTRVNSQRNLAGFGNTFAGRGPAINAAFGTLPPLLRVLQPGIANLVSRRTDFGGFWRALSATAAEVAPVAETQAQLFVALDLTFGAFARVARPYIQETISKSPPTLDTAIEVLPVLRPFFKHSEEFFAALEPGARALAEHSPVIADTIRIGTPVLNASPVLNAQLEPTAQALVDFQETPGVVPGLNRLISFNNTLDPALHFITPAQSVCNYLTLLFRNAASIGSEGNSRGTWAGFAVTGPPEGDGINNEGSPSSAPGDGPGSTGIPGLPNHLHYNPYPNTASPGQKPFECEAGNEIYDLGTTVIGNAPEDGRGGVTFTDGQTEGQLKRGGH